MDTTRQPSPHHLSWVLGLCALIIVTPQSRGAETTAEKRFETEVRPILTKYCYECHADGANKGNVALDEVKSADALLHKPDLWWNVLKNVRSGLMPPARKPRPSDDERKVLERWIKADAFG